MSDLSNASPAAGPAIVFLHGALNDHTVWSPLAAALAGAGYQVLAPDLPAHGNGDGPALGSVEAMADWLAALLAAEHAGPALLVGHSMGSLVALETALRAPERVAGLALLGAAWPMAVSDALLDAARDDEAGAIEMVARWSHSELGKQPGPDGATPQDATRALMLRLARPAPERLLHTDLQACKDYANGGAAAAAVRCPTLFVLGTQDRMTPARSAKTLTDAIGHGKIVNVDAGHAMMAEQPGAVRDALAQFAADVFPDGARR